MRRSGPHPVIDQCPMSLTLKRSTGIYRDLWSALLTRHLAKAAQTHSEAWYHNEQLLSMALDQMLPGFPAACTACLRCFLDHQASIPEHSLQVSHACWMQTRHQRMMSQQSTHGSFSQASSFDRRALGKLVVVWSNSGCLLAILSECISSNATGCPKHVSC